MTEWRRGIASDPTRNFLPVVLATALAIRVWIVATHTYVVWPDETFQYLEPAHRLAFGSGIITWEFFEGIRSWFLPGLLAGVMKLVAAIDDDPAAYVLVIRLLCVLASLSVPFVAYNLAARRLGPLAGLLTGLLAACASEAVYFAPVVMTDPLATYAALLAVWCGDRTSKQTVPTGRLWAAGLLFGLACSLRYQYAPILFLAALVQHARSVKDFARVAIGTAVVVLPVLGGLDLLTWGAPFHSVWTNFRFNALQGISAAIGTQPWFYYVGYYLAAWSPFAPVLLICAAIGAVRVPVLGVIVLSTIGLHSLAEHKELRFVLLATVCMPMLVGIGLANLLRRAPLRIRERLGAAVMIGFALTLSAVTAAATYAYATPADAWHRERAVLQATATARAVPGACGLGVRTIWLYGSGGYTWWHRDLPIYYDTWDESKRLDNSTYIRRLDSRLDGRSVPQFSGPALAANAGRFNVLIGRPEDGLPNFTKTVCFGGDGLENKFVCVFTRPGGCD